MVTWFERMTKYVHVEGTALKKERKEKKKEKNGLGHKSKRHEHETFCRICFIISIHLFIDLYHPP